VEEHERGERHHGHGREEQGDEVGAVPPGPPRRQDERGEHRGGEDRVLDELVRTRSGGPEPRDREVLDPVRGELDGVVEQRPDGQAAVVVLVVATLAEVGTPLPQLDRGDLPAGDRVEMARGVRATFEHELLVLCAEHPVGGPRVVPDGVHLGRPGVVARPQLMSGEDPPRDGDDLEREHACRERDELLLPSLRRRGRAVRGSATCEGKAHDEDDPPDEQGGDHEPPEHVAGRADVGARAERHADDAGPDEPRGAGPRRG
jgi:hypothetical protein